MRDNLPTVDYLFAGAGASATLMLMSLEKNGLLKNKTVVILDPDKKTENDKTYCFWSHPEEQPALDCRHLISHQWSEVSINQRSDESLLPQQYHHISGLDIYKELRRITDTHQLQRKQGVVHELIPHENTVEVITDLGIWQAKTVFDSRPPKYALPQNDDAHLVQSFMGYVITTVNPITNPNCVDLMDFNIDQQGETQFIYVLPYGTNKALVELTRFGTNTIQNTSAEPILHQYILNRFGKYEILNIEKGCIPMSTVKITDKEIPGVIPIGGRAGAIKPSTGYGFKNMHLHAEEITKSLMQNKQPASIQKSARFSFYDRLLLLIIKNQPLKGKTIFDKLFNRNRSKDVLKFLDQNTNLLNDIQIFASLPFSIFLLAVWWVISARIKRIQPHQFMLLLTIGLVLLHISFPFTYKWIEITLFSGGLILLGIPHGAVDHLLDNGHFNQPIKSAFILKYLGLAAINLAIWIFFPFFALIFFLMISVWHFGQTDMQEWNQKESTPMKNFAWGSMVLGIILLGHVNETNRIIENLSISNLPFNDQYGKMASMLISFIGIVWSITSGKQKILLSILMLVISIELPLITSFGLYFIGQHSLNGWSHLKKGMKTTDRKLYMNALPFTIGAILLFFVLTYAVNNNYLIHSNEHLITIFFIFVSCISFPHVMAMSKFYKK